MRKHVSGFTLTELMVTLAVMAALVGMAIPIYQNYTSSGNAKAHERNYQSAVSMVANECAKALLGNPANMTDIYVALNGGAAGAETKSAPGNPAANAYTFTAAAVPGAGQVNIAGLTGAGNTCALGNAVTITSGPVANGTTAAAYTAGDPEGRAETITAN